MEFINGVTCIKGEIHNIMTLFRLSTRWAAHNRFSGELFIQDESPLIRSFRHLNEQLEGIYDLKMVDCVLYLQPFRYVIISDHASGPLTSAALSSISKFVLYGFLSPDFPRASEGINLIANCIPKCIFVETDWESDEVILMKLLELSGLCLQSSSAGLLTVAAAWEIYSTCMSIHSQQKASKLLKSEAESVLRHLTQTSFSRATNILSTQSPAPADSWDDSTYGKFSVESGTWEVVSLRYNLSGSIGITLLLVKIMTSLRNEIDPNRKPYHLENIKFFLSLINIALEAGGPGLGEIETLVAILRGDVCRHLLNCSQSDDLGVFSLSLRVVFNLFASIKNHMKVQLEVFLTSVHLRILHPSTSSFPTVSTAPPSSQTLILAREELALESLLEFCREPSLMYDIYTNYDCDMQCTNLFDLIVSTLCSRASPSGLSMKFSPALSVSDSPISLNILNRLAVEGVLVILHTVATSCAQMSEYQLTLQQSTGTSSSTSANKLSDVDKWCLEHPDDDDEEGEGEGEGLSSPGSPRPMGILSPMMTQNSDDDLDLDLLVSARAKSAEVLRQRRLKKQRMKLAAEKFNEKPLGHEWVRFAADLSLLPKIQIGMEATSKGAGAGLCEARAIALFLKSTPGLGKTQVGEYLSRGPPDKYPFHGEVLREYVNTFDFGPSTSFVEALRVFLGHFRLPGEAQAIDRLMEAFAARVFSFLGVGNPFDSADAAFILAFSTIMLNTDLHNKNMTTKMKLEEFVRNNRGINGGKDLPREYLETLYLEIKSRELMVDAAVTDLSAPAAGGGAGGGGRSLYSDDASWMKLLRKGLADQAPASFTPTVMARRGVSGDDLTLHGAHGHLDYYIPFSAHERDMFLVMAKNVLDVILEVWCCSDDDILLSRILSGCCDYCTICLSLELKDHLDAMLQLVASFAVELVEAGGSQLHVDAAHTATLATINFDLLEKFGPFFRPPAPMAEMEEGDPPHEKDSESPQLVAEVDEQADGTGGGIGGGGQGQHQWTNLSLVRGHALLQFYLHEYGKCFPLLTKGSHYCFVRLLLWGRGYHALPRELIELDDFTDSRGGPLLPSKFCQSYRDKFREELLEDTPPNEQPEGSLWASVTSLGGLLWQAPERGEQSDEQQRRQRRKKRTSPLISASSTALLQSCFAGKKLNELLFLNTRSLPEEELVTLIDCLLAEVLAEKHSMARLLRRSASFYSGRHQARLLSFLFKSEDTIATAAAIAASSAASYNGSSCGDRKRDPSEISELDAVIVLEWVSRVVFLNRRRVSSSVWPLVHASLQHILKGSVQGMAEHCPFLIERAVVAVIRAAMHLIQISGGGGGDRPEDPHKEKDKDKELSSSVWKSVGLIMEVPHPVLLLFAERLGAGLISLVRGSPGVAAMTTVEQWFLIFSLLSCISANHKGRLCVWEILCFLIKDNLISNLNFTPCRDLVIQFINRSLLFLPSLFLTLSPLPPRSEQSSGGSGGDSGSGSGRRGHLEGDALIGGALHMMKLTLMALGGYKCYLQPQLQPQQQCISPRRSPSPLPCPPQYLTFTLPSPDSFSVTPRSPLPSSSSSSSAMTAGAAPAEYEMTVICINFLQLQEVADLWLDSVKILSDLSQRRPLEISKNAIFCVKAILLGGSSVGLPPKIWIEAWAELLLRLPLSVEKLTASASSQRSTNPAPAASLPVVAPLEKLDALELSLRSSTLLFDLLITHFKALRSLEHFQSLWLRTITLLSSSVQLSTGSATALFFQAEFVEMLGSLFRLLSSPPDSRPSLSADPLTTPAPVPAAAPAPSISDLTLLQISWHAARAGCPTLLSLLKRSHPMIAELLLQPAARDTNGHAKGKATAHDPNSVASATVSAKAGTADAAPELSYRSLYSRLFESKPQIV